MKQYVGGECAIQCNMLVESGFINYYFLSSGVIQVCTMINYLNSGKCVGVNIG